jgi:hypothetical protein
MCRARLIAQAGECDATTKEDCKAALVDPRTTTKDAPGPTAPATTNADGKAHSANVDTDIALKRAAAEVYAGCKLTTQTSQWGPTTQGSCLVLAKGKWTTNGGNDVNWNDYWKAKVEKLGEAIAAGAVIDVVTLTSVDYDVTVGGTCASGGAAKVAQINALAKTACGTDCLVTDREQVELTGSKCKFRFRLFSDVACKDAASCDTLSATMAGKPMEVSTTRRRLEAATTECGTTTEECPPGGCTADAQPTAPDTGYVSAASSVIASSAAFTALAVAVAALV